MESKLGSAVGVAQFSNSLGWQKKLRERPIMEEVTLPFSDRPDHWEGRTLGEAGKNLKQTQPIKGISHNRPGRKHWILFQGCDSRTLVQIEESGYTTPSSFHSEAWDQRYDRLVVNIVRGKHYTENVPGQYSHTPFVEIFSMQWTLCTFNI